MSSCIIMFSTFRLFHPLECWIMAQLEQAHWPFVCSAISTTLILAKRQISSLDGQKKSYCDKSQYLSNWHKCESVGMLAINRVSVLRISNPYFKNMNTQPPNSSTPSSDSSTPPKASTYESTITLVFTNHHNFTVWWKEKAHSTASRTL